MDEQALNENKACLVYDDWTSFDLRPLMKGNHEYYEKEGIRFNMCRHVDWDGTSAVGTVLESTKTFAFLLTDTLPISLTDASYLPEASQVMYDDKDNMIGVSVRQNSKTYCYADGE